ncbi:hypothetical protein L2Y90_20465 [Burkholderia pyrrocinia]|uniref:hypothetical protein n=1 Tax=Burkholderia pyrrocinia TaxID=60550 RepID=UPI00215AD7B4|nr:hypothetical protein [Burkholderia pyrrocinia]UVE69128.1 hypothetical protein L2Y90_20465 [Burkholderia pyrrocinia]
MPAREAPSAFDAKLAAVAVRPGLPPVENLPLRHSIIAAFNFHASNDIAEFQGGINQP